MSLSLLPFFYYFNEAPHQLAAIAQLQASLPEEVLRADAEWYETWKQGGKTHLLNVVYFHQLDHPSGRGYRMCFTTAAAMVSSYHGVVSSQSQYSAIREKFGDTIQVASHVKALRHLGLHAEFRNDATDELVEKEIRSGRPVLAGILHQGDLSRGEPPSCDVRGCGHWLVITGYSKTDWIVNDPLGKLDIEQGGHISRYGGEGFRIPRKSFEQRWQVEGKGSGWVILVDR